jgi:hypothetical protein
MHNEGSGTMAGPLDWQVQVLQSPLALSPTQSQSVHRRTSLINRCTPPLPLPALRGGEKRILERGGGIAASPLQTSMFPAP